MSKIRIKSDGTTHGTKVFNGDGSEITGITKIEILPLKGGSNEAVMARLTFCGVDLDLTADDDGSSFAQKEASVMSDEVLECIERTYGLRRLGR